VAPETMPTETNPGWRVYFYDDPGEDHCVPLQDWIEHPHSASCPCGPTAVPWEGKTVYVHHSADGREYSEPDHTDQF
jgi:hypothetical protein